MARFLRVQTEDRPGQLGRLARALTDSGVNIDAVHGMGGHVFFAVNDPIAGLQALRLAGADATTEDLWEIGLPDLPGEVAALGEALGDAGVNIVGVFGSSALGRIHVQVDQPERARAILERYGPQRIPLGFGR